ASSAVAAWKKQGDIAVGNVVGSNIFNILFVLGTAVVIKPITISATLLSIDAIVMVFLSLLLLLFAAYNRKITRAEGAALVAVYLIFVLYQLTSIIR
ncbi:MAG TPA: sodium:calcium antiporter, partial [Candidatus Nanoarchaeia archaeon]|nr:sodium:calcium antiporter [Candidatus Nanoarchaeia archaeon]